MKAILTIDPFGIWKDKMVLLIEGGPKHNGMTMGASVLFFTSLLDEWMGRMVESTKSGKFEPSNIWF